MSADAVEREGLENPATPVISDGRINVVGESGRSSICATAVDVEAPQVTEPGVSAGLPELYRIK